MSSLSDEDKNQTFHVLNHKVADEKSRMRTFFDFEKKGPANLKYTETLAQPKKILLQSTFERFAKFMSSDKQKRILCHMSKVREREREALKARGSRKINAKGGEVQA